MKLFNTRDGQTVYMCACGCSDAVKIHPNQQRAWDNDKYYVYKHGPFGCIDGPAYTFEAEPVKPAKTESKPAAKSITGEQFEMKISDTPPTPPGYPKKFLTDAELLEEWKKIAKSLKVDSDFGWDAAEEDTKPMFEYKFVEDDGLYTEVVWPFGD